MNIPKELFYTKDHEWIRFEGESKAKMGLSDFAQSSLGDLVFINLPEPGTPVKAGESLGDVESVKSVSDIFSPVTGVISVVNGKVIDSPELINTEPYENWLVEIDGISGREELMNAEAYEEFCSKEE